MRTLLLLSISLLAACQSTNHPPITLASQVEVPRFMGDWYVIANIPTFIEKGAHNAVESYRLDSDGSIATTFTFRADGFDGKPKRYQPRGFVREGTGNAVWGMRFVWPFKADYRIVYVNADYTQTVIGREQRDYVWIMARTPSMPEADYQQLLALLKREGYDIAAIQRVPQRWPELTRALMSISWQNHRRSPIPEPLMISAERSDKRIQPNAEHQYTVTAADLPLACPMPGMLLWNSHPKVYLPIEKTGSAKCPYCSAEFTLKK